MLRDLLVHVDGSDAGRRRLQFAIDLALRTGARLSGLHVMPPPDVPPLYKPSQLDEAVANMSKKLASNARAAKEAFSEEVAQRLTDTRWLELEGNIVDGICDRARYADLVILGQYEWQGPHIAHPLPIAHSVVSRCGRPVLVVPAAVGPISFARAAIAWDGSREAVRAVHDALPLLALSQSVKVVTIIAPEAAESSDDAKHLSEHLANHGIKIEAGVIQIRAEEEPLALRQQIEKADYDLLVMGGYSHPMWLEFIFGGSDPIDSAVVESTCPGFPLRRSAVRTGRPGFLLEGDFSAGEQAYCHVWFTDGAEAARFRTAELCRHEFVSSPCRSRRNNVQTVLTH